MGGTTSDQIESHIRSTREDLRSHLVELEGRVKSLVDWREQFRRNQPRAPRPCWRIS